MKPKTEEIYEDPITNLISRNKDECLDNKKQMTNLKTNSCSISDSHYVSDTNSGRSNFNSRIFNIIKRNEGNENDYLSKSNNIAKIKAIYHQSNNEKKENTILIKNSDSKNGI